MCLGVPGKVITLEDNASGMPMGRVSFGGITRAVCMTYVPEAEVGDYVVVHVGFAIAIVDEEEARRTLEFLREMDDLDELDIEQPA